MVEIDNKEVTKDTPILQGVKAPCMKEGQVYEMCSEKGKIVRFCQCKMGVHKVGMDGFIISPGEVAEKTVTKAPCREDGKAFTTSYLNEGENLCFCPKFHCYTSSEDEGRVVLVRVPTFKVSRKNPKPQLTT